MRLAILHYFRIAVAGLAQTSQLIVAAGCVTGKMLARHISPSHSPQTRYDDLRL